MPCTLVNRDGTLQSIHKGSLWGGNKASKLRIMQAHVAILPVVSSAHSAMLCMYA